MRAPLNEDPECRAFAKGAFDGNCAAMRIEDGFRNREAEAAVAGAAGARGVSAIETFENVRESFGRNSYACVFYC